MNSAVGGDTAGTRFAEGQVRVVIPVLWKNERVVDRFTAIEKNFLQISAGIVITSLAEAMLLVDMLGNTELGLLRTNCTPKVLTAIIRGTVSCPTRPTSDAGYALTIL
jgi:hypothetical protein